MAKRLTIGAGLWYDKAMKNTFKDDEVTEAAILILQERHQNHKAEANRAMTYMVYMNGSDITDSFDNPAVRAVETACRESTAYL